MKRRSYKMLPASAIIPRNISKTTIMMENYIYHGKIYVKTVADDDKQEIFIL